MGKSDPVVEISKVLLDAFPGIAESEMPDQAEAMGCMCIVMGHLFAGVLQKYSPDESAYILKGVMDHIVASSMGISGSETLQ